MHGLPVAFALSTAKTDEREVLLDLATLQPNMFHHPDGLILVVDKGYRGRDIETWLNERGITVIRPRTPTKRRDRAAPSCTPRARASSRSTTRSKDNSILSNTADVPSPAAVRVLQRILALTAAIWHTGRPVMRSLVAYDH